MTAVWWVRRDVRLHDNPALAAALETGEDLLPLFIIDPALIESRRSNADREAFLFANLNELDRALQALGSRLTLRRGRPQSVLDQLAGEVEINAIFAEEDHSPYAKARDSSVARTAPLRLLGSPAIHAPGSVLTQQGKPYSVFTPFKNAWREAGIPSSSELIAAPTSIPPAPSVTTVTSEHDRDYRGKSEFPAGEAAAAARLERFVGGALGAYADKRDLPGADGTSRLSPYLRFGVLSPRLAASRAAEARQSAAGASRAAIDAWIDELVWRDFCLVVMHHHPGTRSENLHSRHDSIRWEDDELAFEAWCQGRTGYPLVDAGMRQLLASGWMHNRSRMVAASFLVKHLLIDWRKGELFFMQHLLDGDPASNVGGWQWVAGTGTDAAPYFRIFNPTVQGRKFDPNGDYIRRWVPELRPVPTKFIHEPWKLPSSAQTRAGFQPGRDYPEPIVDHRWARQRALDRYGQARSEV